MLSEYRREGWKARDGGPYPPILPAPHPSPTPHPSAYPPSPRQTLALKETLLIPLSPTAGVVSPLAAISSAASTSLSGAGAASSGSGSTHAGTGAPVQNSINPPYVLPRRSAKLCLFSHRAWEKNTWMVHPTGVRYALTPVWRAGSLALRWRWETRLVTLSCSVWEGWGEGGWHVLVVAVQGHLGGPRGALVWTNEMCADRDGRGTQSPSASAHCLVFASSVYGGHSSASHVVFSASFSRRNACTRRSVTRTGVHRRLPRNPCAP